MRSGRGVYRSGETIAVKRDGVWRLAHHLPGEQPDMREAATYPALARCWRSCMRSSSPCLIR